MDRERLVPEEPAPRVEVKQQVVVDIDTGTVKRVGYCDFENDGSFKPESEHILRHGEDFEDAFHEDVHAKDWRWDFEAGGFTEGADRPPPAPPGTVLVSPDDTRWLLVVDNKGKLGTSKL